MTSAISIGSSSSVKAAKVAWNSSVNSFIDTCSIDLPRITHIKSDKSRTDEPRALSSAEQYEFKEGDRVEVALGYNGVNNRRFSGFVRSVNMGIPVRLECEGYAYLLYAIIFNRSYSTTTVRAILEDLTNGTSIKISPFVPNIPLRNVRFKNATGIQVLEWFKNECKLAVYFDFETLFVGTLFGSPTATVKLKIGWNTVKDDDFKQRVNDKTVRIVVRERNAQGEVKRVRSEVEKYSNEKEIRVRTGIPEIQLQEIANRLQSKQNYTGFEGKIVTFLEPYANKGMACQIDGNRFPEKSGLFFIETITGDFSKSGGRQTLDLSFLSNQVKVNG